ncbi:Pectin lyase-like superfamily protein [Citrus sinensis]|uniref:Pectin lyase-like superfamily protein n=1 Tax=Citrus sinensis TaxID=2711 RepID=A0ACB8MAN1_CITSI|nr:Pectin lyase-like superfamily protein [Citrus sinensis]
MAKSMSLHILLVLIFLILFVSSSSAIAMVTYNVISLGAKSDGQTDSTKAFLAAWAKACGSTAASTIYVPPGSQMFHVVINGCHNVKVQGMRVSASGNSPNTDGIHVQSSSDVTILNARIGTGDDCVSVGHGISIGSLGKESVDNPIVIDQNYCRDNKNCPGKASGVKISDVTYQDIHGTSVTKVVVKIDCSQKYPCSGIKFEDVKLIYKNQPAEASCRNADVSASGFVQPNSCLRL